MSDVTKILSENERCQICRKRKAEFLCDMPVGRMRTLHFKNNDVTKAYAVNVQLKLQETYIFAKNA